jgi:hypothetical protein
MLGSLADSRELAEEHTFTLCVHTFPQILMMRDTLLQNLNLGASSFRRENAEKLRCGKARPAEN